MTYLEAIDFFCGAGGATAGLEKSSRVKVVAAVNHDPDAIACHAQNHPEVEHFNADIREVDHVMLAEKYPDVRVFWWSAECTHFSKAKGGGPRNADSRMLNHELVRFAAAIQPDYIFIENVTEFRTWGPLDDEGRPIKSRKGEYYFKWISAMERLGYHYQDRDLNAADYGARTSRVRLFGLFARPGHQIKWPRQTHTKNPESASLLNPEPLEKWKPVSDILDLNDHGDSIFFREKIGKKPLVPATIKRMEYGMNNLFPDENGVPYVLRYATEEEKDQLEPVSYEEFQRVQFLIKYYSTGHNAQGIDQPCPTIKTKESNALVTAYVMKKYSGKYYSHGIDEPHHTITTNPGSSLISPFILKQWSGKHNSQGVNEPHHTITTIPRPRIVYPMIVPYNFGNRPAGLDLPLQTIMAKRDKYIASSFIIDHTNPGHRLISGMIVDNRILNVCMRMLNKYELAAAQGFPPGYILPEAGTKAKKFIGNSVPPNVCELFTNCQFGSEAQRISGVNDYALTG